MEIVALLFIFTMWTLFVIDVACGRVRRHFPRHDEEIVFRLRELKKIALSIESQLNPVTEAGVIEFYAVVGGKITKVENMFLKVSQSLPLSIAIKDKFSNPAQVDGKPAWAVSDESLASLEVAEDGLSATLSPKGLVGSLKVQVSADADLGEGVKSILGELSVDLLAGEAVSVEIAAGAPSDIP